MKQKSTGTVVMITIASIVAVLCVVFKSLSIEATYPFARMKQVFSRKVMTRFRGMFNGAEASAENVRLKQMVASLSLMPEDIERLEEENARLRRALAYTEKSPGTWLAAGVLSSNGGAAGAKKTIRVDKGSLEGIKVDAVVVVPEGLVGKVTDVTLHTSEITLITDSSLKVSCDVENTGTLKTRGILMGGNDETLVLKYMTNGGEARTSARVSTSGLGGVFPKGIEIGTLSEVRKDENKLVSEARVMPNVVYSNLEDVFIRREK